MNRFVKISLLVIMLAIPLAIFLFLRLFGDNKFDVPIYYQEGLQDEVTNCTDTSKPFVVPDSLVASKQPTVVLFYAESSNFNGMSLDNQVRRLADIFGDQLPKIIVYAEEPSSLQSEGLQLRTLSKGVLETIMHCGFILDEFNRYVLVDRKKRIRGYYGTDLEEVDRLIVEIKILLENGTERK